MDAGAGWVVLAGLAFAVPHVLLGFSPVRPRLAAALGEQGFVALFALVAAIGLAVLALALARSGGGGAVPWGALPAVARGALVLLAVVGLVLAFAALRAYPRSPSALFRSRVSAPRGIEKISRHGFFVGFGAFAFAHTLLAREVAPALAFGVLGAVCAIGALFQDRKLRARHGEAWLEYARQTSVLPGFALLQGRTRLQPDDGLGAALARAAVATAVVAALHALWAFGSGAGFVALLGLGGLAVSIRRFRGAAGGGPSISRRPSPQPGPAPSAPADDPPGP
ncbi:MAG: NnrU family protein [Pseudomonadota bacterium]